MLEDIRDDRLNDFMNKLEEEVLAVSMTDAIKS
jgi:hypothetical protein